ncbi:hypothetical protein BN2497_9793 [Janthinobacterium sp. CG23_2]|nr:hypothetical protein BN2497_9793 [Janthinobacterium sp. CG23_2]CUU31294.1 hypothetical protein BN3177_9793 [Janthinobacterium sp. CG23_2]
MDISSAVADHGDCLPSISDRRGCRRLRRAGKPLCSQGFVGMLMPGERFLRRRLGLALVRCYQARCTTLKRFTSR